MRCDKISSLIISIKMYYKKNASHFKDHTVYTNITNALKKKKLSKRLIRRLYSYHFQIITEGLYRTSGSLDERIQKYLCPKENQSSAERGKVCGEMTGFSNYQLLLTEYLFFVVLCYALILFHN